jgi:hypothetical protein
MLTLKNPTMKFSFMNAMMFSIIAKNKSLDPNEAMKIGFLAGYVDWKHPLTVMAPIKMVDEQVALKKQVNNLDNHMARAAESIAKDKRAFTSALGKAKGKAAIKTVLTKLVS